MIASALEKLGFVFASDWVKAHVSNELIALVLFLCLIVWIAVRINKVIEQAHSKEAEQNARILILEKQQRKGEQLLSACPCISKRNATWYQDQTLNGGEPPEKIACVYLVAKEKGEICTQTGQK